MGTRMVALFLARWTIAPRDRPWLGLALFLLFVLCSLCRQRYWEEAEMVTKHDLALAPSHAQQALRQSTPTLSRPWAAPTAAPHPAMTTFPNGTVFMNTSQLAAVRPSDFHFCTDPYISFLSTNATIGLQYLCEGPRYRRFASHLRALVEDLVTMGEQGTEWGHRTGLPPGGKFLIIGNSHTRQAADSLLCQLDSVVTVDTLEPINGAMARRYIMKNGALVYLIINSYVVHSPRWAELLLTQHEINITSMDAVVLGVFNSCNSLMNSKFAIQIKEMTNPNLTIDCVRYEGPSLAQVAKVYKGPLAYLSMFATYRDDTYMQDRQDFIELQKTRSNIVFMDGRQYIRRLGEECGSDGRVWLVDCVENEVKAKRDLHRCTGPFGGHADLLAWDMIEFFYDASSLSS